MCALARQAQAMGAAMMCFRAAIAILLILPFAVFATAEPASPFEKLAGRWVGDGRLGMSGGAVESVKCRVTYVLAEQGAQLKQSIRCASSGGSIEVQSVLNNAAGVLTGQWHELTREWSGELKGTVTPAGLRVAIQGAEFNAKMDVILRANRQIIEIQFINSALIGMTLVLQKG